MNAKAALLTAVLVFSVGATLPGMQSTLHPRPWVDDVLRVLYFLDRSGAADRGAAVMFARAASTLIWSLGLGVIAGLVAGRITRKRT